MSVTHPAWALLPWLVALLTMGLIVRLSPQADAPGRFATLDGLRGHLAFTVFMHHGVIWYFFLRSGVWTAPPSGFYNHLGQTSVALFFMITAFLFTTRLLDSAGRPIDWLRLYVSRVLRLTPLYLVAMAILFTLCGELSDWHRQVPARELRQSLRQWLGFTIGGIPNVNGVPHTFTLIAGVTWSLAYEWLFYAALPCLALLMRRQVPLWLAALGLLAALGIWSHHKEGMMFVAFGMGGIAAWLARQPRFQGWARGGLAPWCVLALVGGTVATTGTAYSWPTLGALGLAFALVASGCTLFGALTSRLSRRFGDLGYGLYLLHGLLLSATLHFAVGTSRAARWSDAQHWGLLTALAAPLVLLAHLAFRWVEHPAMQQTDRLVAWWRARRR
ncbi:MAG: acyltransferase [Proteobacteria bacterium]|uniref:acyltransferase family protein n=1 Tax=Aquabacterium sp. TaxID=1872578 RepID=UPI0035C6BE38|nr:acyltransferase [Pseudomonadota bacterium]